MSNIRRWCTLPFVIGCILMRVAGSAPLSAQVVVKDEDVNFKGGVSAQLWAHWNNDSSNGRSSQQIPYYWTAHFIISGDLGTAISFFFETDDPKFGIAPKDLASGFIIEDASMEWNPTKQFQSNGGLFIVRFKRNGLQSTLSYIALDVNLISTVTNGVAQSAALPDLGERDANGYNLLRTTRYFPQDFLERETGCLFTFPGLGRMNVLAASASFERKT